MYLCTSPWMPKSSRIEYDRLIIQNIITSYGVGCTPALRQVRLMHRVRTYVMTRVRPTGYAAHDEQLTGQG
jgi:hypothetical protein